MVQRFTYLLQCAALLLFVSGCGTSAAQVDTNATATPTASPTVTRVAGPPTPTNVPSGWHVYSGTHFTIAYPANWTYTTSAVQQGMQGAGVVFSSPENTGIVTVIEEYGFDQSQVQAICQLSGETKTLAGIQMRYVLGGGDHRNWSFVNDKGVQFVLDALDGFRPQEAQAMDDSVLATFRVDDVTPGCAH